MSRTVYRYRQKADGTFAWLDDNGDGVPSNPAAFTPAKRCLVRPAISEKHPHLSQSAACHSSQVKEFNEFYQEQGIKGAVHRPDGTLEVRSKKGLNGVLKARGLYNRDAGYGDHSGDASDPTPVNVVEQIKRDREISGRVMYEWRKLRSK